MSESEHLGKALHHLQEAMLTTGGDTPSKPSKKIKDKADSAMGIKRSGSPVRSCRSRPAGWK